MINYPTDLKGSRSKSEQVLKIGSIYSSIMNFKVTGKILKLNWFWDIR